MKYCFFVCDLHEIKWFTHFLTHFCDLLQLLDHGSIWPVSLSMKRKIKWLIVKLMNIGEGFLWFYMKYSIRPLHQNKSCGILFHQTPYTGQLLTLFNWKICILLMYKESPAVYFVVLVGFFVNKLSYLNLKNLCKKIVVQMLSEACCHRKMRAHLVKALFWSSIQSTNYKHTSHLLF